MSQNDDASPDNAEGSGAETGTDRLSGSQTLQGLRDAGHFLRHWAEGPTAIGAISPSGRYLARAMAAPVPLDGSNPIIELGPGTGSVTKALLAHGVPASRLVLIEYSPEFCALLRDRFPGVTVIEGDAYEAKATLAVQGISSADAFVSSLPLFSQPRPRRIALLKDVARLLPKGAEFVQFSYALVPPVKACDVEELFQIEVSPWIVRNIPPARVWRYRLLSDNICSRDIL